MKSKLVIQIAVSLVLLFALGGLCGYAMSNRIHSGRPAWSRSSQWAQRWLDYRMKLDFEAIQATPEQQTELRPIYDHLLADFNAIQAEAAAKVRDAFVRHGRELSQKLTPEQIEAYKRLNQEIKERRGPFSKSKTPSTKP